ncbi:hypothetical protein BC361_20980 [Ensifer sp. LC54]|nr:hypothetical protein BC363_24500 [Ensifer sp. LC384]OCP24326.1 hypothetical protein BC361_20980 [Ensifer sp. LC54]
MSPTIRSVGRKKSSAIALLCLLAFVLTPHLVSATGPAVDERITPIPLELGLDERKVVLGRRLFFDSRLSGDNRVSCASCHFFEKGLTDEMPISPGLPENPGLTNTPTLFNVGFNSKLGWDGQTQTLEEQIERVVENKRAMGAHWPDVIALLRGDTDLTTAFQKIYDGGLERETVINALAEFEKSLTTPNAPFDRYLRGDKAAISDDAQAGYRLFEEYGCVSCHQGVNLGGNMLGAFGIFGTPLGSAAGPTTPGSAKNSGIADDRAVFRVPSLRNVQHTAPYFHDGSAKTLSAAISAMTRYQLGRDVPDEDITKIEAFLNSLTGEYQGISVGDL